MEEKKIIIQKSRPWYILTDNIVTISLIAFLLMEAGSVIGSAIALPGWIGSGLIAGILGTVGVFDAHTVNVWDSAGYMAYAYAMFAGIWIVVILYCAIGRKNVSRPVLRSLYTDLKGNNWRGILIGTAIGGLLNALCILIAYLHGDISLSYRGFYPMWLWYVFTCVIIQSAAEELICRGFLYQRLMRRYRSPILAILWNSLFFALLHLGNEGVTVLSIINIFLAGLMFSLIVYYLDSMWAAFMAHAAWNYMQNIVFGLPNSGMQAEFSILRLDLASDSLAYCRSFGIEGTVVADIVLALFCLAIFLWGHFTHRKPTNVWRYTEVVIPPKKKGTGNAASEMPENAPASDDAGIASGEDPSHS